MTAEEYPGWGGMRYNEPSLKVTLADGTRDLVLTYGSHEIRGNTLTIHTHDIRYALQVDLLYRVFPRLGILEKHSVIHNGTNQAAVIESAQSGVWYVPAGEGYRLSYLTGRWAGETQLHRETVQPGKKVLESRRGNTSHQANPWFALDVSGRRGRRARTRMVRRHRLERQLEAGGRGDARTTGPRHRRPERFRLRLPFEARRKSGNTGLLRRLHRSAALARARACCTRWSAARYCRTTPRRTLARYSTTRGKPRHSTSTKPARRSLRIRRRKHRRRAVRDGRWLVRPAQRRSRRTGRLVRQSPEIPQRPAGTDQLRQQAGHEVRLVGRAGDGESQQRPLSRSSRLGHPLQ